MLSILTRTLQMDDDFQIYTDITALPADEHEAYLSEGFSGVCTGGTALIKVFSNTRRISRNDLVTILPMQSVSLSEKSADFSMTFFKVDRTMFLDIMSSLGKITPEFFFYMRRNFLIRLKRDEVLRFLGFCRVIDFRNSGDNPAFRRETILHLLRIYYWDFYVDFRKNTQQKAEPVPLNSHKENIALRFAMLVNEHYKEHKEMAFYADILCISPQYLTRTIQEVNGRPARELLAEYVILEVKTLLRNANLDIKDVVRQTGFANQSSLSRFFRRYTGMSPTEYRRSIHIIR